MLELINGNALDIPLADGVVQCCVTSPPYYGLRDYNVGGQLGLEQSPEEYIEKMVAVFREVKRVLRDDGTLWLNMGDSYAHSTSGGGGAVDIRKDGRKTTPGDKVRGRMANVNTLTTGYKPKDLIGMPWRLAFALQADGWWLRSDIIWHKPNPMPESVRDRPTKSHEYIFLLSKSARYYYDADAVRENGTSMGVTNRNLLGVDRPDIYGNEDVKNARRGRIRPNGSVYGPELGKRNLRDVWTITTQPYKGAHFATFPPKLVEPCIKAGSKVGDMVLDPFCGSGTTLLVARNLGRSAVGLDLSYAYLDEQARTRLELDKLKLWHD